MARPERFELPTYCSGGNRSIQLSYGRADGWNSFKITISAEQHKTRCWVDCPAFRPGLFPFRDQQQCPNFLKVAQLLSILEPFSRIRFRRGATVWDALGLNVAEAMLFKQGDIFFF